jgi:hypothetical protein
MIKFFRHIRRSLIQKNQMGKYFKYAIGEIVLVVIGILIALQINNWNERKKEEAFEIEILQQIRANLIKDKLTLQDINTNYNNSLRASAKILNSDWSQQDQDSLKYWLGDIVQFDRFQPLSNAYEVAKSKGIDLISNKQLRFLLGSYYDDEISRVQQSVKDIENAFSRDWVPILEQHSKEFKFKSYVVLKDPTFYAKPSREKTILKLNRDNFRGTSENVSKIINTIDRIQELINQEIN